MRPRIAPEILLIVTLVLCSLCLVSPSQAGISEITLDPAQPREGDVITVTVGVAITSSCWALRDTMACLALDDSTLAFDYFLVYADSAELCLPVLVTFSVPCGFGQLAPGWYTFTAREHHESSKYPDPEQKLLVFRVIPGPLPVSPSTWGRLKTRY